MTATRPFRYAAAMKRFDIQRCPDGQYHAALKILHDSLSADQKAMLVQTLDQLRGSDASVLEGLLIANAGETMVAVTWVQFNPGNAAVVWPPAFDGAAARELMAAVAELLDERKIVVAQILFAVSDPIDEEILSAGGFERLVDLQYLTLERTNFPRLLPSELEFEPHADQKLDRLGCVILRSYQDSLDCPELNVVPDPGRVIAGYQVQGRFESDNWFLVRSQGEDIGCLILAEHPPGTNWELIYMGVVPEARSHNYGEQIVRFAVEKTRQSKAERLVLAVDERNAPAIDIYRRVGFVMWDRRTVYARLRQRG